jgi:hypothetical protein
MLGAIAGIDRTGVDSDRASRGDVPSDSHRCDRIRTSTGGYCQTTSWAEVIRWCAEAGISAATGRDDERSSPNRYRDKMLRAALQLVARLSVLLLLLGVFLCLLAAAMVTHSGQTPTLKGSRIRRRRGPMLAIFKWRHRSNIPLPRGEDPCRVNLRSNNSPTTSTGRRDLAARVCVGASFHRPN